MITNIIEKKFNVKVSVIGLQESIELFIYKDNEQVDHKVLDNIKALKEYLRRWSLLKDK